MEVEIWSDFACPFCYIGKRKFEAALSGFSHRDQVEVKFKSFQLDPGAKRDVDQNVHEMLAAKYGMSLEKAKEMNNQVALQAKEVGLDFQFDSVQLTNTLDAHRLAHFAKKHGKAAELTERLMKAYFTDGLNIGDHQTLVRLAGEVGLDENEVTALLEGNEYQDEAHADQGEGARIGVRGVPFFVFDQKYAVSGAQPSEAFKEALEKVWSEKEELQEQKTVTQESNQAHCSDGSCSV